LTGLRKRTTAALRKYVQHLAEHYVDQDHDVWFREQVKKGLDQFDRGEFLTREEMGTRIEQMSPRTSPAYFSTFAKKIHPLQNK
jgi:predicted transcriptional regulator